MVVALVEKVEVLVIALSVHAFGWQTDPDLRR
jgi:hypothetical protein